MRGGLTFWIYFPSPECFPIAGSENRNQLLPKLAILLLLLPPKMNGLPAAQDKDGHPPHLAAAQDEDDFSLLSKWKMVLLLLPKTKMVLLLLPKTKMAILLLPKTTIALLLLPKMKKAFLVLSNIGRWSSCCCLRQRWPSCCSL